jgi:hypothetical protein
MPLQPAPVGAVAGVVNDASHVQYALGEEYVLRPTSFVYSNLTSDRDVEDAILALLGDFRRRVWAEVLYTIIQSDPP